MIDKRDYSIDILRCVAIICIIIAHINPSNVIFQLRNFDVVLMVVLMGASFQLSTKNKEFKYKKYILNRFKKLILSSWKFLTIIFLVFFLISKIMNKEYLFEKITIYNSYLFIGGIGYVWIMYVFFIVSIFMPYLLKISNKIKDNKLFILLFFIFMWIYNQIALYILEIIKNDNILIILLIQPIPYIIISFIGIRINRFTKKNIYLCGVLSLMSILLYFLIESEFHNIQYYKYPPRVPYIIYGVFVSLFLFMLLKNIIKVDKIPNKIKTMIIYISKNSLTIYFWHIVPLLFIGFDLVQITDNVFVRFIFVFTIAITGSYLQDKYFSKSPM